MNILNDTQLLRTIFIYGAIVSLVAIIMYALYYKRKIKLLNQQPPIPEVPLDIAILKLPTRSVKFPISPSMVSGIGLISFIFVFCLSGVIIISSGLSPIHVLGISFCLAVAGEVSACMIKYSIDLQKIKSTIFAPKTINMLALVSSNIPASQRGEGTIRLMINADVVQIRAKSVDEVVLTKGTLVKVNFADSDKVVVVERYIEKKL